MTYWLDAATKIASVTTKAYVAGLDAIVEQQEFSRQASLEWFTEITRTRFKLTGPLGTSSELVAGDQAQVVKETTQQVRQAGAEVAKRGRDAAIATPREAQAPTPLPQPSVRSRPASRRSTQPGPYGGPRRPTTL